MLSQFGFSGMLLSSSTVVYLLAGNTMFRTTILWVYYRKEELYSFGEFMLC